MSERSCRPKRHEAPRETLVAGDRGEERGQVSAVDLDHHLQGTGAVPEKAELRMKVAAAIAEFVEDDPELAERTGPASLDELADQDLARVRKPHLPGVSLAVVVDEGEPTPVRDPAISHRLCLRRHHAPPPRPRSVGGCRGRPPRLRSGARRSTSFGAGPGALARPPAVTIWLSATIARRPGESESDRRDLPDAADPRASGR
jgi:hypothetical protein